MPIFEVFVVFSGFKYLQKHRHRPKHKCTQFSYWTIYIRSTSTAHCRMEHKESITTHSHVYEHNQSHSLKSRDKHEDISPSKSKIYCTFKRYSVSLLVCVCDWNLMPLKLQFQLLSQWPSTHQALMKIQSRSILNYRSWLCLCLWVWVLVRVCKKHCLNFTSLRIGYNCKHSKSNANQSRRVRL